MEGKYQLTAVSSKIENGKYITEPLYVAYGDSVQDALSDIAERIPADATFVRIIVELMR